MRGIAEALMGEIEIPIFRGSDAFIKQQQADAKRAAYQNKARLNASSKQLWRMAQGANSAVLKKIHNGGTHTAKQLGNQLNYLFSKADGIFGNMVEFDAKNRTLTAEQRQEIVSQWSDPWTGDPKNGHTTHLLLSFPADISAHRAKPVAEAWCMEMFQSGKYVEGEEWAYVAALHTDRRNKHLHIIINNRGIEKDTWFYMAKGHAFDLDKMKERLVEIAEDQGMYLDKTSRVDRGILTYGTSRAELERAAREVDGKSEGADFVPLRVSHDSNNTYFKLPNRSRVPEVYRIDAKGIEHRVKARLSGSQLSVAERSQRWMLRYGSEYVCVGREPYENQRRGRALTDALEQIESNIGTLRSLAAFASLIDEDELAQKIEIAAETLEQGGIINPRNQEIAMDAETIQNRGDLSKAFDKWLDESEKDISKLPPADQRELRRELYEIAGEIVRDLGDDRGAQLMHHEARTALYQTELRDDAISSMGAEREISKDAAREVATQIKQAASDAGIEPGTIDERLALGAANAWQEREWIKQDILTVADKTGFDLSSEVGRGRVAEILDGFYDTAASIISQAVGVEHVADRDRLTRTLNTMADNYEKHGRVEFATDEQARSFGQDFRTRYGESSMARIAEGDTAALAVDFSDPDRRKVVALAVAESARVHQPVGMTLQQVREANKNLHERDGPEVDITRNRDNGHEL